MHPDILQSLAAERAMDMHSRAAAARRGRAVRRGRPTPQAGAALRRGGDRPVPQAGVTAASTGRPVRRWQRLALAVRQLPRRIAAVIAECREAQHRMAELRASPDRYLPGAGGAPQTYQEFLFRTSGPLRHEPPAARRANGQGVR